MADGLVSLNDLGGYNFYSPGMSASFLNANSSITYTTAIDTNGFVSTGGIVTPDSPMSISINYGSLPQFRCNVAGAINAGATQFYGPSAYLVTGYSGYITVGVNTPITSNVQRWGQRTAAASGYGFECAGTDGNLVVSQDYNSYYVHPTSTGSYTRTAVANTNATALLGSGGGYATSYSQSMTQNITFDYPMDVPPLIFVTNSDGPIALNGMIRDGNGKYIGASVCAKATLQTWGAALGYAAVGTNSYNFTYFIVSHDIPPYGGVSTNYGIEVFNSTGGKVFTSRHRVPSMRKATVNLPYMRMNGTSLVSYGNVNTGSVNLSQYEGACINSFHAITGVVSYVSLEWSYGGTEGPMTVCGRYMNVAGGGWVATQGECTASMFVAYPALTNLPQTIDFHLGNVSTMDVIIAKYQL